MPRPILYNISVNQIDTVTGNRLVLVDNAPGLNAAATELGLSASQLSRLLRGQSKYGARSNPRLQYEFIKTARPKEDTTDDGLNLVSDNKD